MDVPQAPPDSELRNIIDKLAQFVARNGPEFEQMTKNKQKGNPKFQFLYGGEFFNYYQYKVNSEQSILKQHTHTIPNGNSQMSWGQNQAASAQDPEIEQIIQQQEALKEQIKQSEQNLSAQHAVLQQQQQVQIETTVAKCETAELQQEADAIDLDVIDLYAILQPIIDNCTKDSISNGKSWILQNATNSSRAKCIAHCLLHKVIHGAVPFAQKLHVIYLVNDVLHHCARKNAGDLKTALESVVVPMFCNASIAATDEQKQKLEKLLKLWESKANYLALETVEKMRQPINSYQEFKSGQVAKYGNEVAVFAQQTKATYDGYQAQHQAFICHAMQQIIDLQQKKQTLELQQPPASSQQQQATPVATPSMPTNIIPLDALQATIQQTLNAQQQQQPPPPINNNAQPQPMALIPPNANQAPPPTDVAGNFVPPINLHVPPPNLAAPPLPPPPQQQQQQQPPAVTFDIPPLNQPPPGFFAGPAALFPDFTKPPPGFAPKPEPIIEEVVPSVPYYDLPAGLMVPLIKLEDTSFKPLDPKDIRLPPAMPTSERLLAAVDAFYALPTHERPRDSEGWEKLGLYEYYKSKNNAKREKEVAIKAGLREKSRTPSPVQLPVEKDSSPPRRRYTSRSPTPPRKRSRSRSPKRASRRSRSRRRQRRSASRSRSRSRTRSRSPRSKSRSRSRSRSRSKSRSFSPPPSSKSLLGGRSSSPPPISFGCPAPFIKPELSSQELDSSNKGHQMLKKMGWGGSGLGANEQGIDSPISGGDVRDRQDQFKGVGCDLNDPYENFRKNKGAAFITRMKARAEERANESLFPS